MSDVKQARAALADAVKALNVATARANAIAAEAQKASTAKVEASDQLAELERQADDAARAALTGGDVTVVDDLEAQIASCKRRLAAAEAMEAEGMERSQAAAAEVNAHRENARWAARAVMAAEADDLLDSHAHHERAALALRWRLEKLCEHLTATRGSGSENGTRPAFNANEAIIERLRCNLQADTMERWDVAQYQAQWRDYEAALMSDPDAPLPEGNPK